MEKTCSKPPTSIPLMAKAPSLQLHANSMSLLNTKAYNVDIVDQFKSQCRHLMDLWPDVMNDDPLMIRDGGQEVGQTNTCLQSTHINYSLVN